MVYKVIELNQINNFIIGLEAGGNPIGNLV